MGFFKPSEGFITVRAVLAAGEGSGG